MQNELDKFKLLNKELEMELSLVKENLENAKIQKKEYEKLKEEKERLEEELNSIKSGRIYKVISKLKSDRR